MKTAFVTGGTGFIGSRLILLWATRGCDVVFHAAAMYELGAQYARQMRIVNVDGARNVFQSAVDASVPKIVYTCICG